MKILITPSKETKTTDLFIGNKSVIFKEKTEDIIKTMKKYSASELKKEYKLNDRIAEKTYLEWQGIEKTQKYPAIYFFNGLMYRNIFVEEMKSEELDYLEDKLRIISPLYGIIKPKDEIAEHRLDFSKNIVLESGDKLVDFWKDDVSKKLLEEDDVFINLLSDEFTKVLTKEIMDKSIIIKFQEFKDGKFKTHSTISKKARGTFVKYLAENKIESIGDIKKFDYDDFELDEVKSSEKELFFIKVVNN